MTRLIHTTAILSLLAATAVHAETARLTYTPSDLATAAGREAVKARIDATAERYCRANPVGGTVAGCRQDVAGQLDRALEIRAAEYAKAQTKMLMQLASR